MTLQHIIDRRQAGKNKSIGNRERFLRRNKERIREAVRRALQDRGIRDLERGEDIRIPRKDLSEPVFEHGPGGVRDVVHTGNREHVTGDRIARPQGGGGGSGSEASDSGEAEDDFVFTLSKEEFMQLFFEDLALPHLIRTQLTETPEYKTHRSGFSRDGTPNNLDIVRSLRGAHGRRLALGAAARRELAQAEQLALQQAEQLLFPHADDELTRQELLALEQRIEALRLRLSRIPFIDPLDLKFRSRVRTPVPSVKAVMFCLMDVSASMDEQRKDLAKRFFMLLYLFLTQHYEKIDLVFIRHHTQAQEVSEHDFFHSRESGGTVVSSALDLMAQIIRARYPASEWNIYGAQAGDGDNWDGDNARCQQLLRDELLPACRYFAYVQVVNEHKTLWTAYEALLANHRNFAMRKANQAHAIYPVFRELFKREGARA
jgi:uncharacterized sporulation protein YeaH/YhbH (DUF444 family)